MPGATAYAGAFGAEGSRSFLARGIVHGFAAAEDLRCDNGQVKAGRRAFGFARSCARSTQQASRRPDRPRPVPRPAATPSPRSVPSSASSGSTFNATGRRLRTLPITIEMLLD